MNYRNSLVVLGVLGTSLCLSAQSFSFSAGDLVATFTKAGSPDFIVSLGNISQYSTQAGGTTVDLTVKYTVSGNNLVNANFGGNTVGVSLTTFGLTATGSGGLPSFISKVRPDALTQSTPYKDVTLSTQTGNNSKIGGVLGFGSGPGIVKFTPADNSAYTAIPVGDANGFSINRSSGSPSFNSTFPLASTSGVLTGSSVYADLYAPNKSTLPVKPDSAFYGYFSMNDAGALSFTAVPEPEEYAAAFGGLALAGALIRRKLRK